MMEGEEAIMSFDSFKQKYANTNSTNFLMYQGIVNSIRALKRSIDIQNNETATLNSNDSWSIILSGNKDVKSVFLVVKDLPTAVLKWNLSFTNLNWTLIFSKCFKISKDTKLQWFQARTLHRILPTNRYLNICKIAENHDCTFCSNEIETIEHLLWECIHVRTFWNELLKLLKSRCTHCDRFNFTKQLVIFGVQKSVRLDNAISFIMLYANFFIYKCKLEKIIPQCDNYIKVLKIRFKTEKYNAIVHKQRCTFETNWLPYTYIFE